MAGIHAEIRTKFAQSAQNYIEASRRSQGSEDLKYATAAEREDIEVRWLAKRGELSDFYSWRQKSKGKSRDTSPTGRPYPANQPANSTASAESLAPSEPPRTGWLHTRNLSWDERKRLHEQKSSWKKQQAATGAHVTEHANVSDPDFEQAIRTAVQETSSGDSLEDARIEQAIRSSIREMRRRSTTVSSNSGMSALSATQTSGTERSLASTTATSAGPGPHYGYPSDIKHQVPFSPDDFEAITDEEYQALIEQAVRLSLTDPQEQRRREEEQGDEEEFKRALERSQTDHAPTSHDEDLKTALRASEAEHAARMDQGHDGQDDEEQLRRAIEASQVDQKQQQEEGITDVDDEEELKRAIEESEKAHQMEVARANAAKTEEEIVMEYVKKQSLAEEQFRSNGKGKEAVPDDEDEDLRRAIEESMRATGKAGESSGQGSGSGSGSGRPAGPLSPKELPG